MIHSIQILETKGKVRQCGHWFQKSSVL